MHRVFIFFASNSCIHVCICFVPGREGIGINSGTSLHVSHFDCAPLFKDVHIVEKCLRCQCQLYFMEITKSLLDGETTLE